METTALKLFVIIIVLGSLMHALHSADMQPINDLS
jgi:hypothetical protein